MIHTVEYVALIIEALNYFKLSTKNLFLGSDLSPTTALSVMGGETQKHRHPLALGPLLLYRICLVSETMKCGERDSRLRLPGTFVILAGIDSLKGLLTLCTFENLPLPTQATKREGEPKKSFSYNGIHLILDSHCCISRWVLRDQPPLHFRWLISSDDLGKSWLTARSSIYCYT